MSPFGATSALNVIDGVAATLREAHTAYKHVDNSLHGRSLVSAGQHARLNFRTVISQALMSLGWLGDVSQTMLRLDTGFWLQAVEAMTTLNGVSVGKRLDPYNPARDFSLEAYPTVMFRNARAIDTQSLTLGHRLPVVEAAKTQVVRPLDGVRIGEPSEINTGRVNPAVGNLIDVTISENGKTATIKVAVRLNQEEAPVNTLLNWLSAENPMDYDWGERIVRAWNKEIDWLDALTCRDMARQRRAAVIKDKSGLYRRALNDATRHTKTSLLSGRASEASRSAGLLIDAATMEAIETRLGGRMSSFEFRQKHIFNTTNFMLIGVVYPQDERVKFYFDTIQDGCMTTLSNMREGNKSNGSDVTDIMRMLLQGSAPSL